MARDALGPPADHGWTAAEPGRRAVDHDLPAPRGRRLLPGQRRGRAGAAGDRRLGRDLRRGPAPGNIPPVAELQRLPGRARGGPADQPDLDLDDPDGAIQFTDWDLDDDGMFDDASGLVATANFPAPGSYDIAVRATDNEGATDVEEKAITVSRPGQQPALCELHVHAGGAGTPATTSSSTPPRPTLTARSLRSRGTSTPMGSTTTAPEARSPAPSRRTASTPSACGPPTTTAPAASPRAACRSGTRPSGSAAGSR